MGIVYEIHSSGVWAKVSRNEYELYEGRKRIRPEGIPPAFFTVTAMLLAYSGRL